MQHPLSDHPAIDPLAIQEVRHQNLQPSPHRFPNLRGHLFHGLPGLIISCAFHSQGPDPVFNCKASLIQRWKGEREQLCGIALKSLQSTASQGTSKVPQLTRATLDSQLQDRPG